MSHKPKLVRRYHLPDMLLHWSVALGFVLALVSGYFIFFQGTSTLLDTTAGFVLRLAHRIGAVLLVAAPVIYFIFSKKRFGFLVAFKYDKNDLGWLKAAPKHYFTGGDLPPQGKYNTGQKMYFLFAILCCLLLALSGFAMWFEWFTETAALVMLAIHDISALAIGLFFFVHVYLVVFHPHERTSFNAMITGYMDADYAKHSHELWYKEVKENEEKSKRSV